jgi:hypothetical protein
MGQPDLAVGIGGAAGDGVASAGNTLALSVARQGLGVYAYNSYQSVIRGGHSWLRLRISARKPLNHGDHRRGAHRTESGCPRSPPGAYGVQFSPCVTFNKQNTYDWFRKRVYKLEEAHHDPTDFHAAMDTAL